ncbi:MAG: gfo/Idh/MocA family oxidoreductase, partial [Actinobacteria bacterium]|nr:gfo/Idh/MocA family oxidoreductase [Actinomycetota bacterium]
HGWLEIDRVFYSPTSMRVTLFDGSETHYPRAYSGHGLREEAEVFKQLVVSGKQQSEILTWKDTVDIIQTLDTVRSQIGLRYPFEK